SHCAGHRQCRRGPGSAKEVVMLSMSPPSRYSRRGLLAAGGALAATALTSCATGDRNSEVSFFQTKREAIPYFSQLAADFMESQSEVRVTHDTGTNLSASFVRNNPPDLGCLTLNLEMGRFM